MPPRAEQDSAEDSASVTVVKVGGSLLSRSNLAALLQAWLNKQAAGPMLLIAGGGAGVEAIRVADAQRRLGQSTSHWLAIEAMGRTAQRLAAVVPRANLLENFAELHQGVKFPGQSIFDTRRFLREEEPRLPGLKLPEHWDVTSDSIAARLAIVLRARELVLLKSVSPRPNCFSLTALAESGYVDAFLPRLLPELPSVRVVDLPGGREFCLTQ